jgi:hypothetical protein
MNRYRPRIGHIRVRRRPRIGYIVQRRTGAEYGRESEGEDRDRG